MPTLVNRRTVHVEWGDCDPAGIVYFPRFFEYFDASTNALFERVGLPKPEMLAKYQILGIPIVETRARFLLPSSFGETVAIESSIAEWGTSSFSVHHRLLKDGVLAAEGFEKRVWTVRFGSKLQSQPIPREVIDRFEKE